MPRDLSLSLFNGDWYEPQQRASEFPVPPRAGLQDFQSQIDMPTIRQQMMDLLSQEACGARDLSRMLGISEKEVYTHLPHIQRTSTSSGHRLQVTPAICLACGYVFRKRARYTRPSRCVRCKNERISEPVYQII